MWECIAAQSEMVPTGVSVSLAHWLPVQDCGAPSPVPGGPRGHLSPCSWPWAMPSPHSHTASMCLWAASLKPALHTCVSVTLQEHRQVAWVSQLVCSALFPVSSGTPGPGHAPQLLAQHLLRKDTYNTMICSQWPRILLNFFHSSFFFLSPLTGKFPVVSLPVCWSFLLLNLVSCWTLLVNVSVQLCVLQVWDFCLVHFFNIFSLLKSLFCSYIVLLPSLNIFMMII